MENKLETTIVCRGYIGISEKKMETIGIMGSIWFGTFQFLFHSPIPA